MDDNNQGIFPKLGQFFSISKKGQGRPPHSPPPPSSSYAPESTEGIWKFCVVGNFKWQNSFKFRC